MRYIVYGSSNENWHQGVMPYSFISRTGQRNLFGSMNIRLVFPADLPALVSSEIMQ